MLTGLQYHMALNTGIFHRQIFNGTMSDMFAHGITRKAYK